MVKFLQNYAANHALTLPGWVPGFWKDDIVLLPSSHMKTSMYMRYKGSLGKGNAHYTCAVSTTNYYPTFSKLWFSYFSENGVEGKSPFFALWKQLLPNVLTCKPMTDLCWECQNNMAMIYRSVNMTEGQKR